MKKVEIDDRFKKALKSKEFNIVQKVDKYGNKVNKQDNTMKNFYNISSKKKVINQESSEDSEYASE